jgi:single stranded DNA-binding protein
MQTNRFELSGYLASKPEARTLPSGTPVANARIGQSYMYDTKEGAKKHTNWFTLAFYGELAAIAVRLEQGDNVNVVGTVQQREFTPKDGSTRKVYEVVVKQCRLVGPPRTSSPIAKDARTAECIEPSDSSEAAVIQEVGDAWAIL